MAQEYTNFALNFMLDALDTGAIYISAHTGAPGLTGANEHPATGAPQYARQLAGYNAAATGSMALTATETLDIFAETITYLGIWDALTVGNFLGEVAIGSEAFAGQGTLDVTALTLDLTEFPA